LFWNGGDFLSRIQNIAIKADYQLEALLDNGSSITLNLKPRLGTIRFALLADHRRQLYPLGGQGGDLSQ
jgi:hypothetical protein